MISLAIFGPDHPGQQHRDDAGAEFQFRLAEEGVVRGDGDVAGERQFAGAGKAWPAHRRDGRAREMPEPHDGVEILAQDRAPLLDARGAALHLLLEVEAGRERRAGPGHDQRAHVAVAFEVVERGIDLAEHHRVERVGALRARQRQPRHRPAPVDFDRGEVLHGLRLPYLGPPSPAWLACRARSSRSEARLRQLASARQPSLASRAKAGGRDRDRTCDPLHVKEVLFR